MIKNAKQIYWFLLLTQTQIIFAASFYGKSIEKMLKLEHGIEYIHNLITYVISGLVVFGLSIATIKNGYKKSMPLYMLVVAFGITVVSTPNYVERVHYILFITLGFLLAQVTSLHFAIIAAIVVGSLDEQIQKYVPNRSSDWMDVSIDVIASFVGSCIGITQKNKEFFSEMLGDSSESEDQESGSRRKRRRKTEVFENDFEDLDRIYESADEFATIERKENVSTRSTSDESKSKSSSTDSKSRESKSGKSRSGKSRSGKSKSGKSSSSSRSSKVSAETTKSTADEKALLAIFTSDSNFFTSTIEKLKVNNYNCYCFERISSISFSIDKFKGVFIIDFAKLPIDEIEKIRRIAEDRKDKIFTLALGDAQNFDTKQKIARDYKFSDLYKKLMLAQESLTEVKLSSSGDTAKGPKILVIDDDELQLNSLERTLKFKGFTVEKANGALLGVKIMNSFAPDLIITDINMPNFTGETLLDYLKKQNLNQKTKTLIISGETKDKIQSVMKKGGDDYLQKPINTKELIQKISDLLA